jgi:hypothetical protein
MPYKNVNEIESLEDAMKLTKLYTYMRGESIRIDISHHPVVRNVLKLEIELEYDSAKPLEMESIHPGGCLLSELDQSFSPQGSDCFDALKDSKFVSYDVSVGSYSSSVNVIDDQMRLRAGEVGELLRFALEDAITVDSDVSCHLEAQTSASVDNWPFVIEMVIGGVHHNFRSSVVDNYGQKSFFLKNGKLNARSADMVKSLTEYFQRCKLSMREKHKATLREINEIDAQIAKLEEKKRKLL